MDYKKTCSMGSITLLIQDLIMVICTLQVVQSWGMIDNLLLGTRGLRLVMGLVLKGLGTLLEGNLYSKELKLIIYTRDKLEWSKGSNIQRPNHKALVRLRTWWE